MDLWKFVKEYYIDSIVYKEGYNIVNTLTWAIILILAVVLLYRYLSKRLEFDKRFFLAMFPFIVFGSAIRIVEDAGFLMPPLSYFFMTPFIYVMVFLIAFPTLIFSLKFRENYHYHCAAVGSLLAISTVFWLLFNLKIENPTVLPLSISLAALASFIFYSAVKICRNFHSLVVIFSHMLDAFSSYIGIKFFDYWELHVLPRYLIENFGIEVLPIAKFFVISAVLYILDRSEDDKKFVDFLKFALFVLGLSPGIRNSLRITFGV
ncbi:MAG: DUF63 family protein [Archaeoglobales archaeon]|nr:DUF63 family protein [Archaeoglobales archaeon]